MAEQRKQDDKNKAFYKASIEMMEQASESVKKKYSKYEGTEDEMEHIVGLIENGKELNISAARNAGYTEDDVRNAEYTKPNGLEIEKYKHHLEKIGLTDDEVHNRAWGETTNSGLIATASVKEKEKTKKVHLFSKKKDKSIQFDEKEGVVDINPSNRTVKGEGFVEKNEDVKECEKNDEGVSKETVDKKLTKNESVEVRRDVGSVTYEFDYSSIPDYVQYDIIPLPSNGECYKSKKSRIPVRYLTAADENIIASPNMYADGKLVDVILRRCVLDKTFSTDEMCSGDRDAVVLWLRATGYGSEFPFIATNNNTGKSYKTVVNLDDFKYGEFTLKGDENGWFEYNTNNGFSIKYKYLSKKEIDEVFDDTLKKFVTNTKVSVINGINKISKDIAAIEVESGQHDDALVEAIEYIKDWVGQSEVAHNDDELYSKAVTENMIKYTMSVNGIQDREYIRNFVENMRASEAKAYRDYVGEHKPGVDLSIEVPIPESDGGGSFSSFLTYGETVFLNV